MYRGRERERETERERERDVPGCISMENSNID